MTGRVLSLFHFNVHWGGEGELSGHRHISETLVPFLSWLNRDRCRRTTIEMSATTVEFLAHFFPRSFLILQALTQTGQIELICAQYAPVLWPAFPFADLKLSWYFAQQTANKLGLRLSKGLFFQEAMMGRGALRLAEEIGGYCICKDDYVERLAAPELLRPISKVDGVAVVVASNHILNEIAKGFGIDCTMYARHLKFAASHLAHSKSFARNIKLLDGSNWQWIHCGDGNHWSSTHEPTDLANCWVDTRWTNICESVLGELMSDGWRMETVAAFVEHVAHTQELSTTDSQCLLEGSWSPHRSEGICRWMGDQVHEWENANGVLTAISQARHRLVSWTEAAYHQNDQSEINDLLGIWRQLLCAQTSDHLGWYPSRVAVQSGINSAHQVAVEATVAMDRWSRDWISSSPKLPVSRDGLSVTSLWPTFCILGSSAEYVAKHISPEIVVVELLLKHSVEQCGIELRCEGSEIGYSPSGMEDSIVPIRKCGISSVPCANGLFRLAEGVFFVKDLRRLHLAIRIDHLHSRIRITTSGPPSNAIWKWRFYLLMCSDSEALDFANSVNLTSIEEGWIDKLVGALSVSR